MIARSPESPTRAVRASAYIVMLGLGCMWPTLGVASDFPGLERLMSAEDYARAGLGKLSEAERAVLDEWLRRYSVGELDAARTQAAVAAVQEARAEIREFRATERIEARVEGAFTGWTGQTIFRLDNGQIWRQRLPGRFQYRGDPNPLIVIARNRLGFYVLSVPSADRGTGVERVR